MSHPLPTLRELEATADALGMTVEELTATYDPPALDPDPDAQHDADFAALFARKPRRPAPPVPPVAAADRESPGMSGMLSLSPKRCRCRTCPHCAPKLAWQLRQRLLAHPWRDPRLFTLTIDRHGTKTGRGFDSPQDAHRHVTDNRLVSRLLALLGVKNWAWVLEFQKETGDGWPHWHILIDLADLPGHFLDLKRAWRIWRHEWRVGGIDLGKKKNGEKRRKLRRFKDAHHAVMYATKYLTKPPEGGCPMWVLNDRRRRIRFVQGSARLAPLVGKHRPARRAAEPDADEAQAQPTEPADRPSLLDRMSRCGLATDVYDIRPDAEGEERAVHVGTLPASPARILALAADGTLGLRVEEVEHAPKLRRTYALVRTFGHLRHALAAAAPDMLGDLHRDAADARRRILADNLFAARSRHQHHQTHSPHEHPEPPAAGGRDGTARTPAAGGCPPPHAPTPPTDHGVLHPPAATPTPDAP